jgi:RND family efflux transporter MFP subunit
MSTIGIFARAPRFRASLLLALCLLPVVTQAQTGGPALVRVATAEVKNIAPVTMVPGTVISRDDAQLSAEVPGRLIEVLDVGTQVSRGDVVARIEDTALRLQNAELQALVTRAEARLRFLESEEGRFARLAESNLAAATQLDQTRSDRDVARGDLEVARARLEQNEDQVSRTRITAPYDGVIVERLMTPGERVIEGDPVVRLVNPENLEVIVRAPLDYYSFVERGQVLALTAGERTVSGTVRTVVAIGNLSTHQFELRLDLDGRPFPVGQTLRVAIPVSDSRAVLTVPRDALVLRPGGQSVFVVADDDTARQVPVTVGVGQGPDLEVMGDIQPGDRVVIRGNERLQAGQGVRLME